MGKSSFFRPFRGLYSEEHGCYHILRSSIVYRLQLTHRKGSILGLTSHVILSVAKNPCISDTQD
jgi:hypothetical protein